MMDELVALHCPGLCAELPKGVVAVEFADDIGLYVSGISRRRNRDLLERAVNIIAERLTTIGLDLEPRKTQYWWNFPEADTWIRTCLSTYKDLRK
ncbi:uncharacterized protein LOC143895335 [Temnothorax americanus]|uniref:uncharacterized protein LOC143895335 n=1 Tax=Temnothorax americanus TaxID=1964332 RepID=UPI0040697B42